MTDIVEKQDNIDINKLKQELEQMKQCLQRTEQKWEKCQNYNEELRQQNEKLNAELHKYRSLLQNRVDAACQTEEDFFLSSKVHTEKPLPDWTIPSRTIQLGFEAGETSIAESLKAAAEQVVLGQAGFVYDEQSGLYYDSNSGYYYDSAQNLYYDPSTGTYFYYDEESKDYKFHSQVSGQYYEGTESANETLSSENVMSKSHKKHSGSRKHSTKKKRKESKHKQHRKSEKINTQKDIVERMDFSNMDSVVISSDEEQQTTRLELADTEDHTVETNAIDSSAEGESEIVSDVESGELVSSQSGSSDSEMAGSDICEGAVVTLSAEVVDETELSASWPPCVRVMVLDSDTLNPGTFFLVTCTGGTIGREKDSRSAIVISDINISKVHAELKFDYDNNCYTVQDLGSQNGTFINDLRISETKVKSASVPISHNDILQVAGTRMLLHIHPGLDTCDQCEPGQVLAAINASKTVYNDHVVLSKEDKKKQARQRLKAIKKKYGLADMAYINNTSAINNPAYKNKALERRLQVGSDHPSLHQQQKYPASVHRPIAADNKGHRMLAKMGWKEGSGLGKDSSGRAEPVTVEMRANQSAGLGSATSVKVSLDDVSTTHKTQLWIKTQQRFHDLDAKTVVPIITKTTVGGDGARDKPEDNSPDFAESAPTSTLQMKWIKGETEKVS